MDNSNIVYSTNPELNKTCPDCRKLVASCRCSKASTPVDYAKINALVRIEKKHRGGKEVTVVERLPLSEGFLKELSQKLKRKCGAGGTFKMSEKSGVVEIQGDKREQIKNELKKLGIKCK